MPAAKPDPVKAAKIKANIAQKIQTVSSADLERIAASFSERFGSYSNQSSYSNIDDLSIFVTENMVTWSKNYISQLKKQNTNNSIYFGISTKSIVTELKSFDEDAGTAEILVKTQRVESTGTINNSKNFYQDILIDFVKQSGSWKVDKAYWQ